MQKKWFLILCLVLYCTSQRILNVFVSTAMQLFFNAFLKRSKLINILKTYNIISKICIGKDQFWNNVIAINTCLLLVAVYVLNIIIFIKKLKLSKKQPSFNNMLIKDISIFEPFHSIGLIGFS